MEAHVPHQYTSSTLSLRASRRSSRIARARQVHNRSVLSDDVWGGRYFPEGGGGEFRAGEEAIDQNCGCAVIEMDGAYVHPGYLQLGRSCVGHSSVKGKSVEVERRFFSAMRGSDSESVLVVRLIDVADGQRDADVQILIRTGSSDGGRR
ncbi:hypothetical protein BU23DRAFT_564202 [Bimuria novae-zelandiae CBS 107.79]|uniref:Uncharacterized protein n=1 Tax=Bimuria novae-zelandiae CBS 107.79 TaxID=1447943 RepID=A0A6A5VPZ6_9PLEO|nr:hypothetical protein BU23DRAFT_564202 [Bimuria novae-zelandiae CBS 107.79]